MSFVFTTRNLDVIVLKITKRSQSSNLPSLLCIINAIFIITTILICTIVIHFMKAQHMHISVKNVLFASVEQDAQNDKDKDRVVIMEFSAKNIASHGIPQIMIR